MTQSPYEQVKAALEHYAAEKKFTFEPPHNFRAKTLAQKALEALPALKTPAQEPNLSNSTPLEQPAEETEVEHLRQLLGKAHQALTWLCVKEVHYDVDVRQAPNLTEAAWAEADAIAEEIKTALETRGMLKVTGA